MQLAVQKNDGLIIDILQEDHEFSDRERELFDIATIADSDIEAMNKEIDSYYKTNLATGGIEIKRINKYYINGKLSWQTV
jgi:hypothetical protein